jgi:hypothetical protein
VQIVVAEHLVEVEAHAPMLVDVWPQGQRLDALDPGRVADGTNPQLRG